MKVILNKIVIDRIEPNSERERELIRLFHCDWDDEFFDNEDNLILEDATDVRDYLDDKKTLLLKKHIRGFDDEKG